jgi:Ras-related protein Rab-6A
MNDFSLDNSIVTIRYKIVILGDVSVGKSSLITRISTNHFKDGYEPSVGMDFANKSCKYKDKILKMQIWDTAGQEKYKSLIPTYLRGSNIVMIVFDLSAKSTFNNLIKWVNFVQDIISNAHIAIVGNKSDLLDKVQVSNDEIEHFEQSYNLKVYRVSAKSGDNINKMFYSLIAQLPAFEKYDGDREALINILEKDNLEETSFINLKREESINFNLDTLKKDDEEEIENDGKTNNFDNKEIKFSIKQKGKDNAKINKCKC